MVEKRFFLFPLGHEFRLGRGWTASLPAGLQHVEPVDPPEEFELLALGLQLQLEARQNADDQREEKVAVRQRLSSVQASHTH